MLLGLWGGTQSCRKFQAKQNLSPEWPCWRQPVKGKVVPRRRVKRASCRIGSPLAPRIPALMGDPQETSLDSGLPHQAGAAEVVSGCLRGDRNGNRARQPGKTSMLSAADRAGMVPAQARQRTGLATRNRPCGTAIRRLPSLPADCRFVSVRCVPAESGERHAAGLRQVSVRVFPLGRAARENGHAPLLAGIRWRSLVLGD